MYTTKLIVSELRREVAVRRRVFPDWVATGRLKPDEANLRIALMEAAIDLIESHDQGVQQLFL